MDQNSETEDPTLFPPSSSASAASGTDAAAESAPPGTDERSTGTSAAAPSEETLTSLSDRALQGRLPPADEARAIMLLKEILLQGRTGVEEAVRELPKLPWIIGVNAVSAAWPEMKTTAHARLIGGLAKVETDAARRVRLSLARGIYKLDVAAAMKFAVGVAKDLREKETGAVTPRNAQMFANVLIGRGKPWLAQASLDGIKPAEADALIHCAIFSVFATPTAPATQLGVLKWAAGSERIGKLHPAALDLIKKTVARWNPKWQTALRREAPTLPEEILAALKAETAAPTGERSSDLPSRAVETAEERDDRSAAGDGGEEKPREGAAEIDDEDDEEERDDEPRERSHRPRPVYESKTIPSQPSQPSQPRRPQPASGFNLPETLRQIEKQFGTLRAELQAAQQKLRQREEDPRKQQRRGAMDRNVTIVPGQPTSEELARLNRQLEIRNAELQQRIEDLKGDSEDRAASAANTAEGSGEAQLRVLLALKLQEDFDDFTALESEAQDVVVQQHYRTVLGHVFEVLKAEGVRLRAVPPPQP